MPLSPTIEGSLTWAAPHGDKFLPCTTWYQITGGPLSPGTVPLVMLHGGPGGIGSPSLAPFLDLPRFYGVPVVLYDQLGCGRSTHLPEKEGDASFWNFELFCREIDALVEHLGLREGGFFLGGASWGGMVAASYAALRPRGLRKLVLSCSPASTPLAVQGIDATLWAVISAEDYQFVHDCHAHGNFEDPEYKRVLGIFMKRGFCRMDPWAEELVALRKLIAKDKSAFSTMHGPSELVITGSYKDWEGWRTAGNIAVDTLMLTGRHSYLTEAAFAPWFRSIPRIKWLVFEETAHVPHFEARERYMRVVADFLKAVTVS